MNTIESTKAKFTLDPGAFHGELLPIIGNHKIGWSGEDHVQFIEALLKRLKDDEGNPVELNDEQLDRLRLIFRPTEEAQRNVLRQTLAEAGGILDEASDAVFLSLMNMAQFSDFLSKKMKPGNKQTYIVKEQKRGRKQKALDSLFSVEAESDDTSAPPQPEEPTPTVKPVTAAPKKK
jgi:hypothetical protein